MSEEQEKLPRAYREGVAEFYGREFLVTPDVLIPRPETEMMVDAVLKLYGKAILPGVRAGERKISERPRMLEVGTGSGIVAITLALELSEAEVVAVDNSPLALRVAEKNAERLGAPVEFLKSDLLERLVVKGSPADSAGLKKNDIIVAVDGYKIGANSSLGTLLGEHTVGETVSLSVLRGSEEKTLSLTLAEYTE